MLTSAGMAEPLECYLYVMHAHPAATAASPKQPQSPGLQSLRCHCHSNQQISQVSCHDAGAAPNASCDIIEQQQELGAQVLPGFLGSIFKPYC